MTPLNKAVTRLAGITIRDGGKSRRLVTTLYPSDVLGLRPHGTRREEFIRLDDLYFYAVKKRVMAQQAERKAAKKRKKVTR